MTAKLGFWTRLLIRIAPRWYATRRRARATALLMARNYDAAGGGRRAYGWRKNGADADAANAPSLATLRNLSRDLRRNNGWARRAIQVIANNTVGGTGIDPKPMDSSKQINKAALRIWNRWARDPRSDYYGLLPFKGQQRLAMETIPESGELLILRRVADSSDGLPVPLRIQMVEPDLIDTSKDGIIHDDGSQILQGIEYDGRGRRVAYWLFDAHPGGHRTLRSGFQSRRVLAKDVLHVFRVERPGQSRGVPWLASAIARLHDLDDYEDAVLMQQKIAACFGAFVKDMDGGAAPLGEKVAGDDSLETLEPGHIEYLDPGKDVTFAQPPQTPDKGFSKQNLRRIAVALGVTYEDLAGDFADVNFSSARMSRLSHYANVRDWQHNMIIPQLCAGVWRWVMEAAVAVGELRRVPEADWSPPPIPMIEPEKEGLAIQRLVRSGARTHPQVLRELGRDPEAHYQEIAEWNAHMDELGIVLDSDPRKTSTTGQIHGEAADASEEPDDDESEDGSEGEDS